MGKVVDYVYDGVTLRKRGHTYAFPQLEGSNDYARIIFGDGSDHAGRFYRLSPADGALIAARWALEAEAGTAPTTARVGYSGLFRGDVYVGRAVAVMWADDLLRGDVPRLVITPDAFDP